MENLQKPSRVKEGVDMGCRLHAAGLARAQGGDGLGQEKRFLTSNELSDTYDKDRA